MPNMQTKQPMEFKRNIQPLNKILIRQGSTLLGTEWDKVVSKALDFYTKQRFGLHYSDSEGTFKTIIRILGFVDDDNTSNNGAPHESVEDVIKRI